MALQKHAQGRQIDQAAFLDYIRAFNARDFEVQHSFYAEDVVLALPAVEGVPPYRGKAGIMSHYAPLFSKYTEVITPQELIIGDTEEQGIFFIMETCFRANVDLAEGEMTPGGFYGVKKGGIVRVRVWAFYRVENGLMKNIEVLQSDEANLGTEKTLEERLEESRGRARKDLLL